MNVVRDRALAEAPATLAPRRVLPPLPPTRPGMDIFEALRGALLALAANKLRAMLTALGIFIGVAAVIATVAVGAGAREQVLRQIQALGANVLVVWGGSVNVGGVRLGAGQRQNLTWDDARAIEREVGAVQAASGNIRSQQQVIAGNQNWATAVQGSDPEIFAVHDWPAERGRLFTPEEAAGGRKVALLGATVAEMLFGDADPVGQEIRIRTTPFEVIGVLSRKGQNAQGQDLDDAVFIPFWTARRSIMGASRTWFRSVNWIAVRVHEGEDMRAAEEELRTMFRQRHRVAANEPDTVSIRNMAEVAATRDASARTLSTLLAAVAAVSLLVGGIGVMNIMLVSVTERTRRRPAAGGRRAAPRHPGAVPGRGGDARGARWARGCGGGHRPVAPAVGAGGLAGADPVGCGGAGRRRLGPYRPVLRLLAGAARGDAGPDPGAPDGVVALSFRTGAGSAA